MLNKSTFMKKYILIISILFIVPIQSQAYELEPTMMWFISSPNKFTLSFIKDYKLRYCEKIYLEATRRRDYTKYEEIICGDIFELKRQQELDYIRKVLKKRWASY